MTTPTDSRRGGRRRRPTKADEIERDAFAFDIEVAEELLALLRDEEGEADEDLLDDARAALDNPLTPRDAGRDQLLLWLAEAERVEVVAMLEERPSDDAVIRHVAHHLDRRLKQRAA